MANGFSTRSQETVAMGNGNFFKNNQLRALEEKARKEAGLIQEETSAPAETSTKEQDEEEVKEERSKGISES